MPKIDKVKEQIGWPKVVFSLILVTLGMIYVNKKAMNKKILKATKE